MSVLDEIVKAYDVRGTVPDQLDRAVAHALGVGFAKLVGTDMSGVKSQDGTRIVMELIKAARNGGGSLGDSSGGDRARGARTSSE